MSHARCLAPIRADSGGASVPVCPAPLGTAGTGTPGSRPHCTPGSGSVRSCAYSTWRRTSARPSVGGHSLPTIGPVRRLGAVDRRTGTICLASWRWSSPKQSSPPPGRSFVRRRDVLLGKLRRFFCHAVRPLVASDPAVRWYPLGVDQLGRYKLGSMMEQIQRRW